MNLVFKILIKHIFHFDCKSDRNDQNSIRNRIEQTEFVQSIIRRSKTSIYNDNESFKSNRGGKFKLEFTNKMEITLKNLNRINKKLLTTKPCIING